MAASSNPDVDAARRDAQLANDSAAELVRVLRTTCRKADFDAVTRVLTARERRAAETEGQLRAALAEEDSARLGRIVDEADAQLRDALREIHAARKKHDEESARLGRVAGEAEAKLVAALTEIHAARKRHEDESARLGRIADAAETKLKAASSEIRSALQKDGAPTSQTEAAVDTAHLSLGIITITPVPVQQQDERRIVEKERESEMSLERVWMEQEGGCVDGPPCLFLKRKADAPFQLPNWLQETMGEKGGPSKLRRTTASVGGRVSKRGKSSVGSTEEMSIGRIVLRGIEKRLSSIARGRRGRGRGHGHGRGRGRGRGRNALDKPVPAAASCSNFRCWLASPFPAGYFPAAVVGGAGASVGGSNNLQSDTQVQNDHSEDEQEGSRGVAGKDVTSALPMIGSAADASDSSSKHNTNDNLEIEATLQNCSSRTTTAVEFEAPREVRSCGPFMPANADVCVPSLYNNGATSWRDQMNGKSGHENVGSKKLGLVLGTSLPVFYGSEEEEIERSFEENRLLGFPSLSIHDISGAEMLNMMGKRSNGLSVAEKVGKCVENKSDNRPKKLSSTPGLGKGINIAGEEAPSHDGGRGGPTNYLRGASQ